MNPIGTMIVLLLALPSGIAPAASPAGKVIALLEDFEDHELGFRRAGYVQWNWTDQEKANAEQFGLREIVTNTPFGHQCLKLRMSKAFPWRHDGYRMVSLDTTCLPPEADAVRLQIKLLGGEMILSVGGPTVYFGHSDVLAQSQTVRPDPTGWQTIEFSLNHNLSRNFRRSEWAKDSPVIYYTRWVQEPMHLNVLRGSVGTILLDQVELVNRGEGRPFPVFTETQIQILGPSFKPGQQAKAEAAVFTAFSCVHYQPAFSGEPKVVRQSWQPPVIGIVSLAGVAGGGGAALGEGRR